MKMMSAAGIALLLCGCVSPMAWHKDGVTAKEFYEDKYVCLQESQQGSSGAYVNASLGVGASRSSVITNQGLFKACMNARGYALTRIPPGGKLIAQ